MAGCPYRATTERLLIAKGRSLVVKAKGILAGEAQTGGELVCRARNSHLNKQEGGMPMQFGIFYEIQVPKPWYETKEFETYQQVLDQVQLADEVGFDTFWTVENHFLT